MPAPPELVPLPPLGLDVCAYAVAPSADLSAARRILRWLSPGTCLTFFDATRPKSSLDSGTFFWLRPTGISWQITGGNHGWTNGVAEITEDEAAAFLHHCFPSNPGPFPACLTVRPDNSRSLWESQWSPTPLQRRIWHIATNQPAKALRRRIKDWLT